MFSHIFFIQNAAIYNITVQVAHILCAYFIFWRYWCHVPMWDVDLSCLFYFILFYFILGASCMQRSYGAEVVCISFTLFLVIYFKLWDRMQKFIPDMWQIVFANISIQGSVVDFYICDSVGMLDEFGGLTKVVIYPACTTALQRAVVLAFLVLGQIDAGS